MGKFDLTPAEQEVWREFRYDVKALVKEIVQLRERENAPDVANAERSASAAVNLGA